MQRPTRWPRLFPLRNSLVAVGLAAGCVSVDPTPELTVAEASCGPCISPPLVDWVRGGADPDELFPRDVHHLHVQLMPADERSFFAWGVGGGEALWVYRVQLGDRDNILGAIAGAAAAHHDAALGAFMSVAGKHKGDPPVPHPSDPVGDPPFAPEVVRVVVDAGTAHEQINQQTFDQLAGL